MKRAIFLLVLSLGSIALLPDTAQAHAGLVSATPEPGTELGSAPGVVTLEFAEPLNVHLSRATVLSPDGARFAGTVNDNGDIVVRLTTNVQGIYAVKWQTVSAVDGHTLAGSFEFGVGVAPRGAGVPATNSPRGVDRAIALARLLEDVGLVAAIGLLLVRRLARRLEWFRAPISWVLALALAGGLIVVFGEATRAAGSPSLDGIRAYLLGGLPGFARLARILLEGVALLLALTVRRAALVVVPLAGAIIALSAAGHAGAVDPRWLGISVEAVHVGASALWVGGILALALQRPPDGWFSDEPAELLAAFTPIALISFTIASGAGIARAAQELGGLAALLTSGYGLIVLTKAFLVLVLAQLSFLAWRRILVHPRIEAALGVAVIGAAVLLAAFPLPPGRAEKAEAQEHATAGISALPRPGEITLGANAGEVLVGISVRPDVEGMDHIFVYLRDLCTTGTTAERTVIVRVEGRPVEVSDCGGTCREGTAYLHAGDRIEVRVGGVRGGVADFTLPRLTAPSADALLATMTTRMHALKSYRLREILNSGVATVRARYEFLAPHSYRAEVLEAGRSSEAITIGSTRYLKASPHSPWTKESGGPRPDIPTFIWDSFQPFIDARLIGKTTIAGQGMSEVAFFGGDESTPVWFRLWIDGSGLVHKAKMRAPGHFMDHEYYDFDAEFSITPPR